LPNEFLDGLEFDQFGNLWIGTSSGVILYKEGGVLTSIEESSQNKYVGTNYTLAQNYPNPFNPSTIIKYQIPQVSVGTENIPSVQLKIFDILGRQVATLVNEKQNPGNYEVEWDANNQPSGVYFFQLKTDNYVETKKMVLLR
jgi:hypothetical protein